MNFSGALERVFWGSEREILVNFLALGGVSGSFVGVSGNLKLLMKFRVFVGVSGNLKFLVKFLVFVEVSGQSCWGYAFVCSWFLVISKNRLSEDQDCLWPEVVGSG